MNMKNHFPYELLAGETSRSSVHHSGLTRISLQISCLVAMFSPSPPNPFASAACLMFAKSSVCCNPIIYLLLNPQFQAELQSVFGVNISVSRDPAKKLKPSVKLSSEHVGLLSSTECGCQIYFRKSA